MEKKLPKKDPKKASAPELVKAIKAVEKATMLAESTLAPVRTTILKRFPTIFALLVTFGITATFLGIERVILKYQIFEESPWLILTLGILTLVFTGRLYKKLS